MFGKPTARVLRMERREKSRCGVCDTLVHGIYVPASFTAFPIFPVGDARTYLEFELWRLPNGIVIDKKETVITRSGECSELIICPEL